MPSFKIEDKLSVSQNKLSTLKTNIQNVKEVIEYSNANLDVGLLLDNILKGNPPTSISQVTNVLGWEKIVFPDDNDIELITIRTEGNEDEVPVEVIFSTQTYDTELVIFDIVGSIQGYNDDIIPAKILSSQIKFNVIHHTTRDIHRFYYIVVTVIRCRTYWSCSNI